MKVAPVVIFAYNRLEHLKKLFCSLEECTLASETEVYIYQDGPEPRKQDSKNVKEVRAFLESYVVSNNHFKKCILTTQNEHKGLANSVILGVSNVINQYGRVIVLEDDLIVTKDFLLYMNRALSYYHQDKAIWSVSGNGNETELLNKYDKDVFFDVRGDSWGWGTWKNRWNKVDWQVKDYPFFKYNWIAQYKFNRGGNNLSNMLDMQMLNKIDSWAIRWWYSQHRHKMLTVYPTHALVYNIGFDGTGTHCGKGFYNQQPLASKQIKHKFIRYDKKYVVLQKRYVGGHDDKEWIKAKILRFLFPTLYRLYKE